MSKQQPKETNSAPDKTKALSELLDKVNKTFGQGSMMTLDAKSIVPVDVVSTGSIGLDLALGVGGLPKGRIIEIYGPESSGKSTLAIHACYLTVSKYIDSKQDNFSAYHEIQLLYPKD